MRGFKENKFYLENSHFLFKCPDGQYTTIFTNYTSKVFALLALLRLMKRASHRRDLEFTQDAMGSISTSKSK